MGSIRQKLDRLFPLAPAVALVSVAALLASCGSEATQTFALVNAPSSAVEDSIPLVTAIEKKMVTVRLAPGRSTHTELALSITPLVRSQPWIRINPGWKVVHKNRLEEQFLTHRTVIARISKSEPFEVRVPFVRLTKTRSAGVPLDGVVTCLKDVPVALFVRSLTVLREWPPVEIVQIAVYAVHLNIPYADLGKSVNAKQVLAAYELLRSVGLDLQKFAIWQNALDQLGALLEAYERGMESTASSSLFPFTQICKFYPFDAAADVVVSSFDRHPGLSGLAYRTRAVKVLSKIGGASEIEVLQRVADYETDSDLFATVVDFLKSKDVETSNLAQPVPR